MMPGSTVPATAMDLNIDFDTLSVDATRNTMDDPQTVLQMFTAASTNPVLMQELDLSRIFQYLMRTMGFKNFEDFRRIAPPINAQVAPDPMVAAGMQEGALMPIGGMNGNGRF